MSSPVLVVNADDFGQSEVVNDGILAAHRDGIVTSTSLMVRAPAAAAAVSAARHDPGLSIGLHVDLGEWRCQAGTWTAVYEVVDTEDAGLVGREIDEQLAQFRDLVGREPSHLDSHQHVHRREPAQTLLRQAGRKLGVPVRHYSAFSYVGEFYGQSDDGMAIPGALSEEHLIRILAHLTPGYWELACHPAAGPVRDSMYSHERVRELETLRSPRVRQAITRLGISLRPFPMETGA